MSRVPRIRFKGFEEDWEQRKLGEVVGIYDGVHQTPKYQDNGIMFLSVENIETLQSSKYISEDDFKRDYKVYPQENDILMTRIGDVGTTNVIADNALKAYYVSLALLKYKSTNPYFLSNAIQSDYVKKGLANRTLKTAIPMKINKDEIGKVDVMLPTSVKEQTKIGEYFRNIDHLITLHQRKLEKLKIIKKSMLENLFPQNGEKTPKIRFSGFTEDWEQRKLEDFGKATGGTSIESEFSEDGIYKVISIGSYSENSVYNDQGIRAIKSGKTSNRVLNRNDLTMILNDKTTSGNIIGRVLLIEESGIYVYNQRTERIEIYLDEYDPVFLYEMLNAPNIREKIIKQAQGNTQIYVNWTAISLLEYMIPSKEEQVKIGEYLHSISNLITLHQSKLEKLQKIKNSMLESMFV